MITAITSFPPFVDSITLAHQPSQDGMHTYQLTVHAEGDKCASGLVVCQHAIWGAASCSGCRTEMMQALVSGCGVPWIPMVGSIMASVYLEAISAASVTVNMTQLRSIYKGVAVFMSLPGMSDEANREEAMGAIKRALAKHVCPFTADVEQGEVPQWVN